MIKWVLSVLFLCIFRVLAQEWVDVTDEYIINPSFEDYKDCPMSNSFYPNGMWIDSCVGWTAPTAGTSDYFNSCNTNLLNSVPYNSAGRFQNAFNGSAYCGFLPFDITDSSIRWSEYIQTKLKKPLDIGTNYHFSFQIVRANDYNFSVSQIGANFAENDLKNYGTTEPLDVEPTIINNNGFLHDTLQWKRISGNFKSNGKEQFLTIGWFGKNELNDTEWLIPPDTSAINGELIFVPKVYYFIDSLKLYKMNEFELEIHLPNFITNNNDSINDIYFYNNPYIKYFDYVILNRWGEIIYKNDGTSIFWDGQTVSNQDITNGTYFILGHYVDIFENENHFKQFIQVIN